MTSPKILHIGANRYHPLPAQHHTGAVWRELARDIPEYHVAARAVDGKGSVSSADGVTLHLVRSLIRSQAEFLFTGVWLWSLIRRIKPDVVLCQCPVFGGLWAYIATRGRATSFLVELHGEHFFRDRQSSARATLLQLLAIPALRGAKSIRVLAADMRESVRKTYGPKIASKCVVIPNRVDLKVFGPVKTDYQTAGPLRLVTVGSFIPLKNHLELIDAVLPLDGVELTIVGAGPLDSEYRRAITAAKAEKRIRLHGWVQQRELAKILLEHDVYVHFSRTEALSRSILEAMAVGLPVVATKVGFIDEVIVDGHNGFLLPEPWRDSLSSAISTLKANEAIRTQLGRRAYSTILRDYEWHAVFTRYREWLKARQDYQGS